MGRKQAVVIAAVGLAALSPVHAALGSAAPRPTPPCFTGAANPPASDLVPVLTPSRVSGVAPLYVFFETTGTASSLTARPFHGLSYCWDFGDPTSGHFATTGLSKDRAWGPVSAHVFETPGVYTVTMAVRDAQDREAVSTVQITVDDPDLVFSGTKTVCFSSGGDFTGCPSGAAQVTSGNLSSLSPHVAAGKRLLLRRGDSFTADAYVRVNVPGPGIIGAYGTGNRPFITTVGNTFVLSADSGALYSDWRIMDLEVDGQSAANSAIVVATLNAVQVLCLRLKGNAAGKMLHTDGIDVGIQECEMTNLVGGGGHNMSFIHARGLAMLGNRYHDSTGGEHVIRLPEVDSAILSHNDLGEAGPTRHLLKLHAPTFPATGEEYSERIILSDNIFRGTGGHGWSVAVGPLNAQTDQRVRDVLVERNIFMRETPGETGSRCLLVWAADVTVRENVFLSWTGENINFMVIETRGAEPPPARVRMVHNTCFSNGGIAKLSAVEAGLTGIEATNNLLVSPQAPELGFDGTRALITGNVLAQGSGGLVIEPPNVWSDFRLLPGSPAVNAGDASFGTRWDYENKSRDALPDAGAFEYTAGGADTVPPAAPRDFRKR